MLIFDVDGVITNPQEKRITESEILDEIIKTLKRKEPVALNTGRSVSWMIEKVIDPLIKKIEDKTILKNFFAVGEKGGTWAEFDNQGHLIINKDENISVPDDLKNEVRNLIKNMFSDGMFYDESKLTMISAEMKDGHSLENYKEKQKILINEFEKILSKDKLNKRFKIDPTTITLDIENIFVGKHFAVKRIIGWVKEKGFKPQEYITIGDSFKSDVPMAEELYSQNLPVKFVYVGKEEINTSKYSFPIKNTNKKYGEGTLEFLKSLSG